MNENNLITKNDERIITFFKSLEHTLDNIKTMSQNYSPILKGERFLTDNEISERLKISRRTLQDYRNEGRIPYIKLGGKILYRESDIQKLLDEGYRKSFG